MRLERTWAIALRHFYLLRGSPARVLPLFAWVAIDIVPWGFITLAAPQTTSTSSSARPAAGSAMPPRLSRPRFFRALRALDEPVRTTDSARTTASARVTA